MNTKIDFQEINIFLRLNDHIQQVNSVYYRGNEYILKTQCLKDIYEMFKY